MNVVEIVCVLDSLTGKKTWNEKYACMEYRLTEERTIECISRFRTKLVALYSKVLRTIATGSAV